MTILEDNLAHSTIRMNNVIVNHFDKIDWEQRRYEVAKDILAALVSKNSDISEESIINIAISYSEDFIKELMNKNIKIEIKNG